MASWFARMKKNNMAFIIAGLLMLICMTPFGLFFGIPFIQEWRTKQVLEIMEGAEYLFEDLSNYGGSTSQRSIYYWIDKSTDEVKNYYENITTAFISSEDDYGVWYIALIEGKNTGVEQGKSSYKVHGTLCSYHSRYDCISIALVDASQSDLYRLSVNSPSQFRRNEPPPTFVSLPKRGTLIVFSYYVNDY